MTAWTHSTPFRFTRLLFLGSILLIGIRSRAFHVAGLAPGDWLLFAAWLSFLWEARRVRRVPPHWWRRGLSVYMVLLAAFVGFGLLATVAGGLRYGLDVKEFAVNLARILTGIATFFLMLILAKLDGRFVRQAAYSWVGAGCLLVLLFALELAKGGLYFRIHVGFDDPNYMAGFLMGAALVGLGLALAARRAWGMVLPVVGGASFIVIGFFSGSRGALIGLAGGLAMWMGLVVLGAWRGRLRWVRATTVTALLCLTAAVGTQLLVNPSAALRALWPFAATGQEPVPGGRGGEADSRTGASPAPVGISGRSEESTPPPTSTPSQEGSGPVQPSVQPEPPGVAVVDALVKRLDVETIVQQRDQSRFTIWLAALRMFARNPWGVGIANFAPIYPLFTSGPPYTPTVTHNFVLEVLTQTGLVGVIAFLAFAVTTVWGALAVWLARQREPAGDGGDRQAGAEVVPGFAQRAGGVVAATPGWGDAWSFAAACVAALTAVLVQGLSLDMMSARYMWLLFGLCAALPVYLRDVSASALRDPQAQQRRRVLFLTETVMGVGRIAETVIPGLVARGWRVTVACLADSACPYFAGQPVIARFALPPHGLTKISGGRPGGGRGRGWHRSARPGLSGLEPEPGRPAQDRPTPSRLVPSWLKQAWLAIATAGWLIRSTASIVWLLGREQPDVLYLNGWAARLPGTLAAAVLQTPVVWHVHERQPSSLRLGMEHFLARWGTDQVICVSQAVEASFPAPLRRSGQVVTVYNGVALPAVQPELNLSHTALAKDAGGDVGEVAAMSASSSALATAPSAAALASSSSAPRSSAGVWSSVSSSAGVSLPGSSSAAALASSSAAGALVPTSSAALVSASASGQPPLRVAWIGRLTPAKGLHVLLAALEGLTAATPLELDVYGDSADPRDQEYRDRMVRRMAAAAGQPAPPAPPASLTVRWHGFQPAAASHLGDVDLLVQPSLGFEALPTTLLEAMAAGCFVVATAVGGVPELLQNAPGQRLIDLSWRHRARSGTPTQGEAVEGGEESEPGEWSVGGEGDHQMTVVAALRDILAWAAAHPDEVRRAGKRNRQYLAESLFRVDKQVDRISELLAPVAASPAMAGVDR